MLEVLNNTRKNKVPIDLIQQAIKTGTRGSGVTAGTGPAGESAYVFNGTANAYFEFPFSAQNTFQFINKPFELEAVLFLTSTASMELLGNLVNSSGASDWAMTMNNTYQVISKLSLDGRQGGVIVRNRYAVSAEKLPTNKWFNLKLRRRTNMTTMDLLIDNVIVSTLTGTGLWDLQTSNPFRIGASVDGAFPITGTMAKLTVTML